MAYREVTMIEVKEVVRQHLAGVPKKRIAARVGLDPKTVRRYVEVAERHGLNAEAGAEALTDERLGAVMAELGAMPGRPHGSAWQQCDEHRAFIEERLRNGLRLTKVRKLLVRQGIDIPYPTLHRFAVEELGFGRKAPTVPVADGEPGSELQVDTGWLTTVIADERGRRRRLRVWVFTPSVSRYRFIWPCFEETTRSAIEACEAAWDFYGGVFGVLIPDNTKAIVARPDPLDPKLTEAFLEYAQDRGFVVDPTRTRRPTDKARVERTVRWVREDCFDGETIRDLEHARQHGRTWCEDEAGTKRHSRTGRRPIEHFESVEQPALRPPPTERYDIPHWCDPLVSRDHYAQVLRALYSLPTQYIGKRLRARADRLTVRFYDRGVLIKTHPRKPPGGRSTDESDFPAHQGAVARRDLAFVEGLARRHGPNVHKLAKRILDVPLPWTRVRRVYALVGLAKKHGSERLDEACALALHVDMEDVKRIARILEQGPIPQQLELAVHRPLPSARFLRSSADYALTPMGADEPKEE